jgi:hypothetical protein
MGKRKTDDDQEPTELGAELGTTRSSAERVATHARRQRASGLIRVSVWVPNQQSQEIHRIAWQMRVQANATLPSDHRLGPHTDDPPGSAQPEDEAPTLIERRPGLPGLP